MTFMDLSGQLLSMTARGTTVRIVTPAGSMLIEPLNGGKVKVRVVARPGQCADESAMGVRGAVSTATATIGANGAFGDAALGARFESAQRAFACGSGALESQLRSFLSEAGLGILHGLPNGSLEPPASAGANGIHTMGSDCGTAEDALALALIALYYSAATLDPAGVAIAAAAYAAAYAAMRAACG